MYLFTTDHYLTISIHQLQASTSAYPAVSNHFPIQLDPPSQLQWVQWKSGTLLRCYISISDGFVYFVSVILNVLRPGLYFLWLCPSSALYILCMCYVFGFATCLWIIFRPNLWVSRVSLFITSFAVQVSDFALDRAHPLMLIGQRRKGNLLIFMELGWGLESESGGEASRQL